MLTDVERLCAITVPDVDGLELGQREVLGDAEGFPVKYHLLPRVDDCVKRRKSEKMPLSKNRSVADCVHGERAAS